VELDSRTVSVDGYRFGFNSKEKLNEISGDGNVYDFGSRLYDNRISRFINLDSKSIYFPELSPFLFAYNNPILLIDVDGEYGDDPRWEFYRKMGGAAIKAITSTNVEVNKYKSLYVLSQYRIENGFNLSPPGNNPFNIKGSGDKGQITLKTTEYINGKSKSLNQNFANFSTLEKGFEGYMKLLKTNFPNAYSSLFNDSKTVKDFAEGLLKGKEGVYATDPNYAEKMKEMLIGVVRDFENNLNSQISSNKLKIINNEKVLQSKTSTKSEKAKAQTQITNLNKKNNILKSDLNELKDFKKNEGIN
jgi:RHS repeat-associated protein